MASPSPTPRPLLSRTGSSRRSSAIYQLPPLLPPTPSPPPAPPAPPPEHFCFFPTPLPLAAAASNDTTWLYGWQGDRAAVVAGAVQAASYQAAQQRVQDAFNKVDDRVRILARCYSSSEKEAARDEQREREGEPSLLQLYLPAASNGTSIPTILSSSPTTTLITYTPPRRSQLQFLSLVPLQLDLNSFSSPSSGAKGKGKGSSAAQRAEVRRKREEEEQTESHVLGEKLRRSAELDFSHPSHGPKVAVADLEEVVDWVRLHGHLGEARSELIIAARRSTSPHTSRRCSLPLHSPSAHPSRFLQLSHPSSPHLRVSSAH